MASQAAQSHSVFRKEACRPPPQSSPLRDSGYTPLASILGAMFLLAIPASAALLQGWNDGTRFGTAAVLEGAWKYTASRIMPIAAGLAVIGAVVNFAFGRPAIRLIGSAAAFLTISALWRLVVSMM